MKTRIQVSEKQDIQTFLSYQVFHAYYSKTFFVTSSDPNNNVVYSNKLSCQHGVYNLNFVNLSLRSFDLFT